MSDLDKILDQRGMNSLKWEFMVRNGEPEVWKETDPEPVSYTHLTLPTTLQV